MHLRDYQILLILLMVKHSCWNYYGFKYSYELNFCKENDLKRVYNHFKEIKLPYEINHLFKKNS